MKSYKAFREKLEQEHTWPDKYLFKFVVPIAKKESFVQMFKEEHFEEKHSREGNYISFTLKKTIHSTDEIIDMYLQANEIEGLIAL
jgi:hypothetical protein